MDEGNVLNDVLQHTLDFIDRGFGLIQGEVYWLFGVLLVINLTLAGLTWATSQDDVMVALSRRVFYIGFFAWLVLNWPTLIDTVGESFVRLGFKAGNAPGLYFDFYNPGLIVANGWGGAWTIVEASGELTGIRATFVNLPQILILLAAAAVYFVTFALLAFQVFMAMVQFKVGALMSFVLLPMALVNKTAFLAERPIGWLIASGVRLMAIAIVMSLGDDLVRSLTVDDDVTIREAVAAALGASALFLLARMATSLAGDLVQGSPSLGMDGGRAVAPAGRGAMTAAVTAGALTSRTTNVTGRAVRFAAVSAASVVPGGSGAAATAGMALSAVGSVAKANKNR